MHKKTTLLTLALMAGILFGCSTDEFKETESGLSYKFVKNGEGPAPEDGKIMVLNISYLDENNNIIFTTEEGQEGALALAYSDSMFARTGGIEEGIKMIQKGDSLILKFPIEDLYENTFSMELPDTLSRGSIVTVCMGAAEVFTTEEFQVYRERQFQKMQVKARAIEEVQFEKDKQIIEDYLSKENITAETHESGLRYMIIEAGNGPLAQSGQKIEVDYTGKFLDGTIFDTSNAELARKEGIYDPRREPYGPISFQLGTGGVIQGWDIGFGLLNKGSKAIFYIPSKLAYGPRQMSAAIPANAIMEFEVKLLGIGE